MLNHRTDLPNNIVKHLIIFNNVTPAFGLQPQCHVKKKIFEAILQEYSKLSKYSWTKESKGPNASRMGQGYIQFNPPHRTSSLGFICSSLRLYKIPSFCCLLITRFRYYWRQIRNVSTNFDHMTSNSEVNAFDVSLAMVSHLTSYHRRCA